jgi:DNA-binding SARP family transcriptional activator
MLHIKLFGATAVVTDGGSTRVTDFGGVKPRQILEILAATPGTPVTKDRLADLLWDGEPPKSYVGTLESYVCGLRRKLGQGKQGPSRLSPLTTTSNGYLLDPAAVSVDLAEFRGLAARAATATPAEGLRLAQQAVAMLSGELLASEAYATWACSERKVFQRDVVETCVGAARNALEVHDYDAAERMSRLAVSHDSLAEDAWQLLMSALSAAGRGGQAIRAYVDLRTAMVTELGMEPGPVSQALYMEILCADSAQALPHNGHRRDSADLSRRLRLLHRALEAITGVSLPALDGPLAEMAVQVLAGGGFSVPSREAA